jgi:hypothetical protein
VRLPGNQTPAGGLSIALFAEVEGASGNNCAAEDTQNAAVPAKTRHGMVRSALMAGSRQSFWKSHCTQR